MNFLQQACIPLDLRMACADAALAYAEDVVAYLAAPLGYQRGHAAATLDSHNRLLRASEEVASAYLESL